MSPTSRRTLMALTAGGGLTLFFGGCGQPTAATASVCYDPKALSTSQVQKRQLLKYVDVSSDPQKVCSGCENFAPDAQNASCGACSSLGGPVEPGGHCGAWRARA